VRCPSTTISAMASGSTHRVGGARKPGEPDVAVRPLRAGPMVVKRATLNLGLRFDHFNASAGADPRGRSFVGSFGIDRIADAATSRMSAPRLGAAYDLLAMKTALRHPWAGTSSRSAPISRTRSTRRTRSC